MRKEWLQERSLKITIYACTDIFDIRNSHNLYGWNGHLPFYGRCPLWHRRHHWHYRIFHRLFYQWKDGGFNYVARASKRQNNVRHPARFTKKTVADTLFKVGTCHGFSMFSWTMSTRLCYILLRYIEL